MPTIAASSYSFWSLFRQGRFDMYEDAARLAREAGADAIEYALGASFSPPLDHEMADRLCSNAAAHDMPICSVVVSAELYRGGDDARVRAVDLVVKQLEHAHAMGAQRFRHDATLGPEDGDLSDDAFENALPIIAQSCRIIAERAAELNITSSIENHGLFMQHAGRVRRLIEAVDHSAFGVTLDIGNALFADQDHVAAARTLAQYAITVHAKDFVINPTTESAPGAFEDSDVWNTWPGGPRVLGCALGDGDVKLRECVEHIVDAKFSGPWVVEFEGPWPDPREATARGISYLRSLLKDARRTASVVS